jgi:hypothetical protein
LVKREPVTLKRDEEIWLREEAGLRACYTWNDGYSIYRCAAANRGTTKQQMVADLLLFWGSESGGSQGVYKQCKQYIYVNEQGTECVEEFTEILAQTNTKALQLVQQSLDRGTTDKLNKRYTPPEHFFEALAAIDEMVILIIDTTDTEDLPRYRVHSRGRCLFATHMESAANVLREAKNQGYKICGVASKANQYCCLYPVEKQPNFAGCNAIGQFM